MSDASLNLLREDGARLRAVHLRSLFEDDGARFDRFSRQDGDVLFDFSKEKLDAISFSNLIDFCHSQSLEEKRDRLFAGDLVNNTERRPALHMALRCHADDEFSIGRKSVVSEILRARSLMHDFAQRVHGGDLNFAGRTVAHVLHIGIGGSDLGPRFVCDALGHLNDGPSLHFVANVDPDDLRDSVRGLDPARTLVIIASKSFSTQETLSNLDLALSWLKRGGVDDPLSQCVAVTANADAALKGGLKEDQIFIFPDWVGGRFSVWSSIGLCIAIGLGNSVHQTFLDGARAMDQHFRMKPLGDNFPVLAAIVSLWRRVGLGYPTTCLLPYSSRLSLLPSLVQQIVMESNGKRVLANGCDLSTTSSPTLWGAEGSNAQHSFFQQLHQGLDVAPVDFIVNADAINDGEAGRALLANALAQSRALAFGRTVEETRSMVEATSFDDTTLLSHRTFDGDRPSTSLLLPKIDPFYLGWLIAFFEHRTFAEAALFDINPFDQWGVELGKTLANGINGLLRAAADDAMLDVSTRGMINHLQSAKRS